MPAKHPPAKLNLSDAQFGDLHQQLHEQGGFTINPKTGEQPSTGWMVGQRAHTHVEPGVASAGSIKDYTESRRGVLERKQAHLGGWHKEEEGVDESYLDVAHRWPGTPAGQTQSRRSLVAQGEQESFNLATFAGDVNPFSPETVLGRQFPEFSGYRETGESKKPSTKFLMAQPEVQAWIESPRRRAAVKRDRSK